jgi:predicted RNase H-related nuclease YkuK (DUF458 family)
MEVNERKFKSLTDNKLVDLISHVREKMSEEKDVQIYIGTDSQNHGEETDFATVVVLHYGHRGGHVIYTKETIPRARVGDSQLEFNRLWKEVEMSIEVSEYVESMGYTPRCKPYSMAASYAADRLCK